MTHSFPFQAQSPAVTINLMSPDPHLASTQAVYREDFRVDTGFSEYLQLDWELFSALHLSLYTVGTISSELADGSSVVDIAARVRVVIEECGVDEIVLCISNPQYDRELRLFGGKFLKKCNAVIDYRRQMTRLADQ